MAKRKYHFHDGQKGAAISVRVTPRARRNEIVEVLDDLTIKIRLTAPPVEGKANQALIDFLSDILGIPKSKIEIVAGHTSREKLVAILDVETEAIHRKLVEQIQ